MEPTWITELNSTDPKQRLLGIKSLVKSEDPRAMQVLKHLYENDPDPTVKEYAKKAAQYIYQRSLASQTHPKPQTAPPEASAKRQAPGAPPSQADPGISLDQPESSARDGLPDRVQQSANQKLQQALTQQMRGNLDKALKYIEAAFELNPSLEEDTFAVNLACSLTGLPREQALLAIREGSQAASDPNTPREGAPALADPEEETRPPAKVDFGKESKTEQVTRELLESLLVPGENLLAYSGGALPGLFANKPIAAGLTADRLVIQPLKKNQKVGPALNIWREYIDSMQVSRLGSRLVVKVPQGSLVLLPTKPIWKKRLQQFKEALRSVPLALARRQAAGSHQAEQLAVFKDLGLIRSALSLSESSSPAEGGESSPSHQKLADIHFSNQVAAGFLLINILLIVLFAVLGMISGIPPLPSLFISAAVDLLIGLNLWKGQSQPWSGWAMVRAGAGALLYGAIYLSQGLYLDLLGQLSFCGAVLLVLTGDRDRLRSYTAMGIYAIGYLGLITVTFLIGFLTSLAG